MSTSDGPWKLEGFPDKVECPAGDSASEVQRAYEEWKESRKVNPQRGAVPVDHGGERYTSEVKGARYVDERSTEWQLMCDYDINPGLWGRPGKVVYVDSGFIESPGQPD